jgi:hypothetical protein
VTEIATAHANHQRFDSFGRNRCARVGAPLTIAMQHG